MTTVAEIMTRHVKLTTPEAPLPEVAREMEQSDIGLMPVGESDQVIGTITDRDIAMNAIAKGGRIDDYTVRHAMTEGVEYVYEDDNVENAVALMREKGVQRLPVLNDQKELSGIVALADVALTIDEAGDVHQAAAGTAARSAGTMH